MNTYPVQQPPLGALPTGTIPAPPIANDGVLTAYGQAVASGSPLAYFETIPTTTWILTTGCLLALTLALLGSAMSSGAK